MEAPTSNHTCTNLYNREQEFSLAPPCHPGFSGCNQIEATTPCVQAPTWTSEDNSPPEHLPTTLKYWFCVTQTYYSDIMFNNGLPDSSLFCCISLLCLPHSLSAHITYVVCSSAFYALCSMSIHCTVPLMCYLAAALSFFFTHESPSPTTTTTNSNNNSNRISSLYRVYIASVHLLHAIFAIPMHAHTAPISSTSRVLCVIIIVTLHLLWPFFPRIQHH